MTVESLDRHQMVRMEASSHEPYIGNCCSCQPEDLFLSTCSAKDTILYTIVSYRVERRLRSRASLDMPTAASNRVFLAVVVLGGLSPIKILDAVSHIPCIADRLSRPPSLRPPSLKSLASPTDDHWDERSQEQ